MSLPSIQRVLITVDAAASLLSARREVARAVLEAQGLVKDTPFGPRVPVQALIAWANEQPPANQIRPTPAPTPAPRAPAAPRVKLRAGGALPRAGRPVVAALLPLDWLATQGRAAFWREYPADVLVLDRRPSFSIGGRPTKGTASTNYMWAIWPAGGAVGRILRDTTWRQEGEG